MPRILSGAEVERGFRKLIQLNTRDPRQGLKLRKPPEFYGYYWVDGVPQFHVSSKSYRSGDVQRGRAKVLRDYLKLSPSEFEALCECPMTGPAYHELIKARLGL